jgi:hypothetical protein
MSWIDLVETAKNVIVSLAAIATSGVAMIGLNKWRSELKGKANFEVARALMRATYNVRNEVQRVRAPFVATSEFPSGYAPGGTPKQEADAWAHVFRKRWEPLRDALVELETHQLEAEALWGAESKSKVEDLLQCAQALFTANQAFVDDKASGGQNFKTDKAFAKEMKATVFASAARDDRFSKKIERAVEKIEDMARPYLQRS